MIGSTYQEQQWRTTTITVYRGPTELDSSSQLLFATSRVRYFLEPHVYRSERFLSDGPKLPTYTFIRLALFHVIVFWLEIRHANY